MASEEVVELRARVAELEQQLAAATSQQKREKVERMSAEVVDSNPYRWAPNGMWFESLWKCSLQSPYGSKEDGCG